MSEIPAPWGSTDDNREHFVMAVMDFSPNHQGLWYFLFWHIATGKPIQLTQDIGKACQFADPMECGQTVTQLSWATRQNFNMVKVNNPVKHLVDQYMGR